MAHCPCSLRLRLERRILAPSLPQCMARPRWPNVLCCAVLCCAVLCCAALRPTRRCVATLWELQAALCAAEGTPSLEAYEGLGLGPLTAHPRVQELFAPHPEVLATAAVPRVTTQASGRWAWG